MLIILLVSRALFQVDLEHNGTLSRQALYDALAASLDVDLEGLEEVSPCTPLLLQHDIEFPQQHGIEFPQQHHLIVNAHIIPALANQHITPIRRSSRSAGKSGTLTTRALSVSFSTSLFLNSPRRDLSPDDCP